MDTNGVFDQGIREWVRYIYQMMRDAGLTHESAKHQTETMADQAFGFWKVSKV
jgi:hypothetical protein